LGRKDQLIKKKGAPLAIKINAQLESQVNQIRAEHIDGGSSSLIDLVVRQA
jgi:hypothetical protein